MIVVVSVHAYNIGVVKYDWKVLYTVTRSDGTRLGMSPNIAEPNISVLFEKIAL